MKQRILFIDGPLGGGGAERVLIDILRNIDFDHYEVDLALICRGGALMDEVPQGVNVIELWPGYSWDYKLAYRLSKWFRCNRLFSRKMNGAKLRRDYDIEISFLEGMPLKLGALRTTSAKKATWVHADLFTHRYEVSQFYPGEEERDYNRMDYVVNVSKDCEDAFRKRFPNCKAKHRVIYNPIDRKKIQGMSDEYAVETDKDNRLTVITVGRVTPPPKKNRSDFYKSLNWPRRPIYRSDSNGSEMENSAGRWNNFAMKWGFTIWWSLSDLSRILTHTLRRPTS